MFAVGWEDMSDTDTSELRRQIYASIARPELFEDVMAGVDRAMMEDGEPSTALSSVLPEFEIADEILVRRPMDALVPRRTPEIAFSLTLTGRISTLDALTVTETGLRPDQDISAQLGERGLAMLTEIAAGQRTDGLAAIPLGAYGKPVLLVLGPEVHGKGTDISIAARAMPLAWRTNSQDLLQSEFQLTAAEIEIVRSLFAGARPKEIARERGRSVETIRSQIRSILHKMSARDLADIQHICYALIAAVDTKVPLHPFASGRELVSLDDGRVMDVELTGPRDGKPLLFLHGCLGGRSLMPQALSALADRRIIAPGRPAHGQSTSMPTTKPDIEGRCGDLLTLLNHLGVRQTEVLAYDTGAAFALALAAIAPERISAVKIVAGMPPLTKFSDLARLPYQQRVFPLTIRTSRAATLFMARLGGQRLLRDGPDGFASTVFAGVKADLTACETRPALAEHYWRGHAWHIEQGPEGFVSEVALAATDWASSYSELAVSVTWVHGTHDLSAPVSAVQRLCNTLGIDLQMIDGAGHSLLHAQTDAWASPHET